MLIQVVIESNEMILASCFRKKVIELEAKIITDGFGKCYAVERFEYQIVNEKDEILFATENCKLRDNVLLSIVDSALLDYDNKVYNPVVDLRYIIENEIEYLKEEKDEN